MDTKLKRFNPDIIKKVVALILCLLCVAGCAHQAITSLCAFDESGLYEYSFYDALVYSGKRLDKMDISDTRTFRLNMSEYSGTLFDSIGRYGNGSEEAYSQWKKSLEENNKVITANAKKNLIDHVVNDDFFTYLQLINDKTVVPLGFIQAAEYSGSTYGYEENSVISSEIDYYYLLEQQATVYNVKTVPDEVQKKADELGADGVFEINNFYQITSYDWEREFDRVKESYQPGYYAFKINEAAVEDALVKYDIIRKDDFGSAEEFARTYEMYQTELKEKYSSGRYFIKDGSGRVYTNIDGLDEKSTKQEIEEVFYGLGFYCVGDGNGNLYKSDGEFYGYGGYDYYYDYETPVVTTSFEYTYMTTTTLPSQVSTTGVDVTAMTETDEGVTAPVAATSVVVTVPEPTTYHADANDRTPFVDEGGENWLCYIGVDMFSENFAENDQFRTAASRIERAKEILLDFVLTCGILGVLFLACFVYLIVKSGRRKGSEEIHLFRTDRMFTDWRIILDCLLGWGVFALFVIALENLGGEASIGWFIPVVTVLVTAFAAVVIDLVLFITRHIKNRSLLKRLFPVWLCKKCYRAYKDKIKPFADEKFLYTKDFGKGTVIRIAAVVAVNIILGFLAVFEMSENYTCFTVILIALFDLAVLVWMIRFIGGIRKIFSALDEIKEGNYDVQINLYALPSTLRESARKVMKLRDGLKTAVEEAVKQEQTKTELITNVSHDLKTPLTSIINYVELLKKCEINDGDAKEYLGVLGEKSDRLKKLIEDLVEASKASTGNIKVDLMQVSLNEMVSQLLGEHADGLERKKLNVIADMPEKNITVNADGKLLYRVMENLIVNVEKYSLYGTRVYVTVKEENGFGTVTFKNISEQPLNITADQLKERFVRGDESRSTEGNGLGLSIAQSLCDVQGGELEIAINGDLFTAKVKLKK